MYDIIVYMAGKKKNKRYILINVGKWNEKFHLFGKPTENFPVSSKNGMFLKIANAIWTNIAIDEC